jgi:hypothetical protein
MLPPAYTTAMLGRIQFWVRDGELEIMRFDPEGDIYVRGRLVTNDLEVVDALRQFLIEGCFIKPREGADVGPDGAKGAQDP